MCASPTFSARCGSAAPRASSAAGSRAPFSGCAHPSAAIAACRPQTTGGLLTMFKLISAMTTTKSVWDLLIERGRSPPWLIHHHSQPLTHKTPNVRGIVRGGLHPRCTPRSTLVLDGGLPFSSTRSPRPSPHSERTISTCCGGNSDAGRQIHNLVLAPVTAHRVWAIEAPVRC